MIFNNENAASDFSETFSDETLKKIEYQKQLFSNRLKKKYRELKKYAKKERLTCYRIYDRDIPEIPVSLDFYEFLPSYISSTMEAAKFYSDQSERLSKNEKGLESKIKERTFAVLYLYERPYEKSWEEENLWLENMADAASEVLGIEKSHIIKKSREHKSHHKTQNEESSQYEKKDLSYSEVQEGLVLEQGQIFKVNLTNYLDTGLFFDHRILRSKIREKASKKRILNLFCYTGSFSVYAAQGNASFIESVDLSNTYLLWAKENMKNNGFEKLSKQKYVFTKADCKEFLKEKAVAAKKGDIPEKELYDIIILDPPTFSNSKAAEKLDINKDWPQLVKDCMNILAPGGELYFSTNSEKLKFDSQKIPQKTAKGFSFGVEEITASTIPFDYEGKKPHRVWHFILSREAKTDKEFL